VERHQRKNAPDVNDYFGKSKKNMGLPGSEKHSNLSTIAIPTLM